MTKPDFPDYSPAKIDDRISTDERITFLIQLYIFNDLTEEENEELQKWIVADEDHQHIFDETTRTLQLGLNFINEAKVDDRLKRVKEKLRFADADTGAPVRTIHSHMKWWLTAACFILLTGIGIAVYLSLHDPGPVITGEPGQTTATLTLSESNVLLDPATKDGVVKMEEDYTIIKKDGQIIYTPKGFGPSVPGASHTISTPRAGTHPVVLSDGTKFWLSPSSSASFSPVFAPGKPREVTITGEVFFEVASVSTAKGKTPFIVKVKDKDVRIEVLGTHFNVNAYPEEPSIKTTLVEGSVKVIASGQSSMLKPGQQAEVANKKIRVIEVGEDGTRAAKAWKEGYFDLNKSDIKSLLREIGRWYKMDIVYTSDVPTRHFGGQLSRDRNLKQVINALSYNGINCEIKGKKLIVLSISPDPSR
jgi:transmembrane sensor